MNRSVSAIVYVVACCGFALVPGRAAGAPSSCARDSDCDHGFVCKVVGASSCPAIACPAGTDCPLPEPCETHTFYGCVPGPCATGADCADGMVCFQYSERDCPGTASCPAGVKCPPPAPSDCTDKTVSTCVPPYVPPCKVDSDCGDGFKCVEDQSCQCSGGTARPSDAGSPSKPADSDCSCTPAGTFHCEMKAVDCSSNADCAKDWTCVEVGGSGGGCAEPVGGGTSTDASSRFVCDAGPPTIIRQCLPPFYDVALPGGTGKDYAQGNVARNEGGPGAATGAPMTGNTPPGDKGCGCRIDGTGARRSSSVTVFLGALALLLRRRARRGE